MLKSLSLSLSLSLSVLSYNLWQTCLLSSNLGVSPVGVDTSLFLFFFKGVWLTRAVGQISQKFYKQNIYRQELHKWIYFASYVSMCLLHDRTHTKWFLVRLELTPAHFISVPHYIVLQKFVRCVPQQYTSKQQIWDDQLHFILTEH